MRDPRIVPVVAAGRGGGVPSLPAGRHRKLQPF
jgi:hypothetical protein